MIFKLFFLFTAIPLIELAVLIRVGKGIGAISTIAIVLVTGVAGAWLARAQGMGVLRRIRKAINDGSPPSSELVDGAFILVGGALLLTPGLLTDLGGFFCLVPGMRVIIQRWVVRKIIKRIDQGAINVRAQARWAESDLGDYDIHSESARRRTGGDARLEEGARTLEDRPERF